MKPTCSLRVDETIALPKIIVNPIVATAVITNQITQWRILYFLPGSLL
ncbi:hypothetical protein [Bacteroides xylanisolvens]|nr:hypothetical protein [Bacteroides xylanisolvens]